MLPVADEVLLLIGESFLPLQIGFFYFALIPSALRLSECLYKTKHTQALPFWEPWPPLYLGGAQVSRAYFQPTAYA